MLNGALAASHRVNVLAELAGELSGQRDEGTQRLGTTEQLAVYFLLEHVVGTGILGDVGIQLCQEVAHTTLCTDGGCIKLDAHLLRHLGRFTRWFDKSGENSGKLGADFGGVTRYTGKGCKSGHQFIDTHAKRGSVTAHTRQGSRQLLETGHTVLGGHLYLILNLSCFIPLETIVLNDGAGDGNSLTKVGNTTDTGLGTLLKEVYPVVLGHTVTNDLI